MGTARRHALGRPAGRFHVWCSPHNPSALELLEELKQFGGWMDCPSSLNTLEGHAAGWGDQLLVTQEIEEMASADIVLQHVEKRGCARHSG